MGVAITGIGLMTPLGQSREQSWGNLLSGNTKNQLQNQPCDNHPVRSSALCIDDDWIPKRNQVGRLNAIALKVAKEAIADAGWIDFDQLQNSRFACVIGTSKGPLEEYYSQATIKNIPRGKSQLPFLSILPSGPLMHVRSEFGITGPSLCPVSACATGLDAVLRGVRLIEQGDCDFVLAGSADASANQYVLNSYRKLGILATQNRIPQLACQPFDAHRSGFVIGEGAAMFVLVREDSPWYNPEKNYATCNAGISYNDPAGLTQLDLQGKTLRRLLADLLKQANYTPQQINLLHLHGTATASNDVVESAAIESIFGSPANQPFSTASKGAHGHALGAASSIELAWMLLSLRDGIIPPVTNLETLDKNCPIRPVLTRPLKTPLTTGLKLSLGFGGHQIGGIFSRGNRFRLSTVK